MSKEGGCYFQKVGLFYELKARFFFKTFQIESETLCLTCLASMSTASFAHLLTYTIIFNLIQLFFIKMKKTLTLTDIEIGFYCFRILIVKLLICLVKRSLDEACNKCFHQSF